MDPLTLILRHCLTACGSLAQSRTARSSSDRIEVPGQSTSLRRERRNSRVMRRWRGKVHACLNAQGLVQHVRVVWRCANCGRAIRGNAFVRHAKRCKGVNSC